MAREGEQRMLPKQRRRAGLAVVVRINQLGLTVPRVAKKAGVSANTVRRLIKGETWPNAHTREQLNAALEWPAGELGRRAVDGEEDLQRWSTLQLIDELRSRVERGDA